MKQRLSDETIDGLLFEARLASNPKVIAARDDYYRRKREFREANSGKSKDEMIAELKAHCPAYIEELLQKEHDDLLRDRYVTTFMPSRS